MTRPTIASTLRALGWRAGDLADALGVDRNTIYRWQSRAKTRLTPPPFLWRALRDVLWEHRAPPDR